MATTTRIDDLLSRLRTKGSQAPGYQEPQQAKSVFDSLDAGARKQVEDNMQGMLTGDAYASARLASDEALARAAGDLRAQSGGMNAPRIGQGAAIQAQQQTEQDIFSTLAATKLQQGVEEQEMKERGMAYAQGVGKDNETIRQYEKTLASEEVRDNTAIEAGLEQSAAGIESDETMAANRLSFDYNALDTETKLAYDSMSSDEKKFFAGLSSEEKLAFAKMGSDEKMFYADLSQQERLTYAQLGSNEKIAFAEMNSRERQTFAQLESNERQTFAQLGSNEKIAFVEMNSRERMTMSELGSRERLTYAQLSSSEKIAFAEMESNERIEFSKLTQNAKQFESELEWMKEAKRLDMSDADAARIWQSSENMKQREFETNLTNLENKFTEKGWNFQTLMQSLDSLPEADVARILGQIAVDSGMTYTVTDANGEPVLDAQGNEVTRPGFPQYSASTSQAVSAYNSWKADGSAAGSVYKDIESGFGKLVDEGNAVADTYIETIDPLKWNTGKYQDDRSNRWILSDDARNWATKNSGKLYRASNGRIYEIVGVSEPKDLNSKAAIVFKDLQSGTTLNWSRGSGFPQ